MPLADRLRRYIAFNGMTIREFEKTSGIPYRTLQDYLSDKRKPGADHLTRLAEIGVDVNWLLTGKLRDTILRGTVNNSLGEEDTNIVGADTELLLGIIDKAHELTERFKKVYSDKTEKELDVRTILGILAEYTRAMLTTAAAMAKNLEELREKGVSRDIVIDILSSPFGEDFDRKMAKRMGVELPMTD